MRGSSHRRRGYFLYSSVGRLRQDVAGLTADQGRERMRQWADEVTRYFQRRGTPLGDEQKLKLAMLRQKLEATTLEWSTVHDEVLGLVAKGASGGFSAEPFLRSSWGPFRPVYRAMIADVDGMERLRPESVARSLDARCSKLVAHYRLDDGQQRKLAAIRDGLKQDAAAILGGQEMQARLADYQVMLATAGDAGRRAYTPFARERAQALRKRADDACAELLSYATEPADELTIQAINLATVEQLKAGPVRVNESPTPMAECADSLAAGGGRRVPDGGLRDNAGCRRRSGAAGQFLLRHAAMAGVAGAAGGTRTSCSWIGT